MVRVRFAPSPTGYLHIGGLRTALYNYLLARKTGGAFLLRIEDTDQQRFVAEAEEDILASLQWAGLAYDEGPNLDGGHGPYYQSQRSAIYPQYVQELLANGHAYYAFDTPEEIEAMRERLKSDANPQPKYDAHTRLVMRNSFTLSEAEVQDFIASGVPYVIRMKLPESEVVTFQDTIRGEVSINTDQLDDQVLMKSDGLPTYHLANIVDDHLMGITHVIRGEEWLPSTPKHVLLYRFLGWDQPQFAHLPLILSPSGGKLSKRKAEAAGIPVSVKEYVEQGYEPDALLNFLALLGWNEGTDQEVYPLDALIQAFQVERIGQAGVQFSMDKLKWYNGYYLRHRTDEVLAARVRPYIEQHGKTASDDFLLGMVRLMKERITFAEEVVTHAPYFFEDPMVYEPKPLKKAWKPQTPELLAAFSDQLSAQNPFEAEPLHDLLHAFAAEKGIGLGAIMSPLRLALTGMGGGPDLFALMALLGKETVWRRIQTGLSKMPQSNA